MYKNVLFPVAKHSFTCCRYCLCLVKQMLSSTTARSEGFISNGLYAVLFYRSLLGGGFDLSNDVLSSTIPGTDGLGTCFSKHLTSQ